MNDIITTENFFVRLGFEMLGEGVEADMESEQKPVFLANLYRAPSEIKSVWLQILHDYAFDDSLVNIMERGMFESPIFFDRFFDRYKAEIDRGIEIAAPYYRDGMDYNAYKNAPKRQVVIGEERV